MDKSTLSIRCEDSVLRFKMIIAHLAVGLLPVVVSPLGVFHLRLTYLLVSTLDSLTIQDFSHHDILQGIRSLPLILVVRGFKFKVLEYGKFGLILLVISLSFGMAATALMPNCLK